MVTITNIEDLLEARRQEALSRLANRYPHFVAHRDEATGGHIVRNPHIPGRVEIVTATGCTCNYGRTFGVCKHIAAVLSANTTRQDASWQLLEGGVA